MFDSLLLVSSADNLCRQFGSRSGPTIRLAWSGPKLFDTMMVFSKEFFEIADFEKKRQGTKKVCKISQLVGKELKRLSLQL